MIDISKNDEVFEEKCWSSESDSMRLISSEFFGGLIILD